MKTLTDTSSTRHAATDATQSVPDAIDFASRGHPSLVTIPPPRFTLPRDWRARIGFVLVPNERTIEAEMIGMAPEGVGVYFSRGTMPRDITVANLRAMHDSLAATAGRILPDNALDVICYACTSGTVVLGEQAVAAELGKGATGAKATTLLTGVIEGLRALDARRIVVGTPYLDEINSLEADYLSAAGFEVVAMHGLQLHTDDEMVRLAPDYLVEFACAIDRPDADAVFISCGALRTVEVIAAIEEATGKPAICSNQAMLWHCLRLAGIDDRIPGYGRLLIER